MCKLPPTSASHGVAPASVCLEAVIRCVKNSKGSDADCTPLHVSGDCCSCHEHHARALQAPRLALLCSMLDACHRILIHQAKFGLAWSWSEPSGMWQAAASVVVPWCHSQQQQHQYHPHAHVRLLNYCCSHSKHNGTVRGRTYFVTREKYGTFVQPGQVCAARPPAQHSCVRYLWRILQPARLLLLPAPLPIHSARSSQRRS